MQKADFIINFIFRKSQVSIFRHVVVMVEAAVEAAVEAVVEAAVEAVEVTTIEVERVVALPLDCATQVSGVTAVPRSMIWSHTQPCSFIIIKNCQNKLVKITYCDRFCNASTVVLLHSGNLAKHWNLPKYFLLWKSSHIFTKSIGFNLLGSVLTSTGPIDLVKFMKLIPRRDLWAKFNSLPNFKLVTLQPCLSK